MGVAGQIKVDVSIESLRVIIYVFGGRGLGESILGILTSNSKPFYTFVLDSCESDGINPVIRTLDRYNVKKIDLLFWTHPHDDHSVGMDNIITSFYRKGTVGIIPMHLFDKGQDVVEITDVCSRVLKTFHKKFRKKNLRSIECMPHECREVAGIEMNDKFTHETKRCSFQVLTPIDYVLDNKIRSGEKLSKSLLNHVSLSLIMDFDGYCFYFGGDVQNTSINQCDAARLKSCRWIKIPHHGSNGSSSLLGKLNNCFDTASSTTFLSQPLPVDEVLRQYHEDKKAQVYVTQEKLEDPASFGIIKYVYDFTGEEITADVYLYGNAYKYPKQAEVV